MVASRLDEVGDVTVRLAKWIAWGVRLYLCRVLNAVGGRCRDRRRGGCVGDGEQWGTGEGGGRVVVGGREVIAESTFSSSQHRGPCRDPACVIRCASEAASLSHLGHAVTVRDPLPLCTFPCNFVSTHIPHTQSSCCSSTLLSSMLFFACLGERA